MYYFYHFYVICRRIYCTQQAHAYIHTHVRARTHTHKHKSPQQHVSLRSLTPSARITGRVQFDLLPVIRRMHKLRSYSLNNVSAHFLHQRKAEVHYSIISGVHVCVHVCVCVERETVREHVSSVLFFCPEESAYVYIENTIRFVCLGISDVRCVCVLVCVCVCDITSHRLVSWQWWDKKALSCVLLEGKMCIHVCIRYDTHTLTALFDSHSGCLATAATFGQANVAD